MTSKDGREIKMDDANLPMMQEEYPVLASHHIHDPMGGLLQEASSHNCTNVNKNNSLDQCGTSFSGLDPPCVNAQSIPQTGYIINGKNVEKYKNTAIDIVDLPSSKGTVHLKQGQWSHLYKLVNGSKNKGILGDPLSDPLSRAKDKLMVTVRENSRRDDVDPWHSRHLRTTHMDETGGVCSDVNSGKNPNSESASLPQDARLKILSTSSFSQFFGKKTPKGKGLIHGLLGGSSELPNNNSNPVESHQGGVWVSSELPNGGNSQSVGRLFSTTGPQRQLLRHHNGVIPLVSGHNDLNLREWLKPGHCTKSKAEGLIIFRQIAELVYLAYSQGVVLQHLRPSYFILIRSNKVKYIGLSTQIDLDVPISRGRSKKRPPEEDIHKFFMSDMKQQKLINMKSENHPSLVISKTGPRIASFQETNCDIDYSSGCDNTDNNFLLRSSHQATGMDKSFPEGYHLEEKWYACPEEVVGKSSKFSSNIYSLGVLLFELLCHFDSLEAHSTAMFHMHHRILPPFFLSESPKEAGFCLWLIHPEPSSRPTIREILHSDLFCGVKDCHSGDELSTSANDDFMAESELLLDFLASLKEKKRDHAMSLVKDIRCIEADIKGWEGKPLSTAYTGVVEKDYNSLEDFNKRVARSCENDKRLVNHMSQLEKAYFSMRPLTSVTTGTGRADRDLLKNREAYNEAVTMNQKSADGLDTFFEGLCKFNCYSKFELRGTLRNADLLKSANVICSLSLDRDEEYIAVAGASRKIKIFEFSSLVNDTIDIHYPVIEMGNKSKLSCISWNSYIKNYLASTDYDGTVQVWEASSGVAFSQHVEHQKRAWSVDFSRVDPTRFASGSDDCSMKLWCINEKRSTCTIWSPANVCCVQFSPNSSHLLAFGSADYKTYVYDLRHTRIPWCTLAGHEKAVSYVKFIDSETLVSASTDNTLKLWDLNKTSLAGLSTDACHLTYTGHTNKKHFVGLAVHDGYIACGSESNEVFTYYRSLPMPITAYKFSPLDPVAQHEIGEDSGLFVSSVCWRSKSNMVVAANSGGSIRLLELA